jgi:hypothetical protein
MAKPEFGAVAAGTWQSSTASSAAVDVSHLTDVQVALAGTFVGTVFVDVSWDGTNFAAWGSLTAPGAYTKIPQCKQFKMRTSAYTSGTPNAGYTGARDVASGV